MGIKIHTLTEKDLTPIFGEITDRVSKKIKEVNLKYTLLSSKERDLCILRIVKGLIDSEFEVVGAHRQQRWEVGWGDNLNALKKGEKEALIPHYFKNDQIARFNQEFIKPTKHGFDLGTLTIILEWLYEKYMKEAPVVYEFGCGTGHHLLQLQSVNPRAKLWGLDWATASQEIIGEMVKKKMLQNTEARRFDFFKPDNFFPIDKDAVVYTVNALEQVGEQHAKFVDYLLQKKPAICVHIEPIAELLDQNNLLDYLAIEYFRHRGYLWNFLTRLRALEKEKKLKIHEARRTYLGGNMYVDHYSVIVWSPC